MKTLALPRLLALAALLPLSGCADHATSSASKPAAAAAAASAKPPAPLPPAPGAAATITEADSGHTVHIGLSETVAIRLAVNESTGNRWFLNNALVGGVLVKKGSATYANTPTGTVATIFYQGMKVGKQELHFGYAPLEARQNTARTADFRVIVQ